MPKTSIAEITDGWEKLVITVKASLAEVPHLTTYTGPLELVMNQVRELSIRLETRRGVKQQESQERRALLKEGSSLASRARAALKAHYGLQNERLVEYGATPIRKRSKAKEKLAQPPATVPAPPSNPETK